MSPGTSGRWAEAEAALAAADPAMAGVIARAGPCGLVKRAVPGGVFGSLARAICYQQLAGAAAAAIHGRFAALYDGHPSAAAVAATPVDVLRSAGLSAGKAASILDLAAKTLDGTVPKSGWTRLSDDEVISRLVAVRGIGPWTAQMFLIFQLMRPDVWPVADLGVRNGWARMHGVEQPSVAELALRGEVYRPWRSVAAWYCWWAVVQRAEAGW